MYSLVKRVILLFPIKESQTWKKPESGFAGPYYFSLHGSCPRYTSSFTQTGWVLGNLEGGKLRKRKKKVRRDPGFQVRTEDLELEILWNLEYFES